MTGQLPANLTADALALSPAEYRTFPRWYTDLLLRRHADNVTVGDVLHFLDNFGVSEESKREIISIFGAQLAVLEPVQFYIFLRLAGHLLQGKKLRIELAFVAAPVPHPRSILASKKPKKPVAGGDIDSFMSLMTGNGVSKKRKKRVTFDSRPPQVNEAAQRSMEELLRQLSVRPDVPIMISHPMAQISIQVTDDKDEPDQPIVDNHFAHVNIDTVLHNGQSILPKPPAPRGSSGTAGDSFINQLTSSSQQQSQQQSPQRQQQSRPPPPPQRLTSSDSLRPRQQLSPPLLSPQGSGFQGTGLPAPENQWSPRQKLPPQSTGSLPISLQSHQQVSRALAQQQTGPVAPQPALQAPGQQNQLSAHHSGSNMAPSHYQGLQMSNADPNMGQLSGMLPPHMNPSHISAQSSGQSQNLGANDAGQYQPGQLQMQGSGQMLALQMQGSGSMMNQQPLLMQGSGSSQPLQMQGSGQLAQMRQMSAGVGPPQQSMPGIPAVPLSMPAISSGHLHPPPFSTMQLQQLRPGTQPHVQYPMNATSQMLGYMQPPGNGITQTPSGQRGMDFINSVQMPGSQNNQGYQNYP